MSKAINFTKEAINALPIPPTGKRDTYLDTKMPGLQVRVTETGAKTFSVYRRIKGGSPERVTLGKFPAMTVEQARKQAGVINVAIADGANPAEAKRAHRGELTFSDLFKEYGERHGSKKRSWSTDQSLYANHLQSLAPRKLSAVTKDVISRILSDLDKAGKAGATVNNVRALISSMFSRAIEWGHATGNPVSGIKTRAKVKRDRFLQSDELPRFFQSLAQRVERDPARLHPARSADRHTPLEPARNGVEAHQHERRHLAHSPHQERRSAERHPFTGGCNHPQGEEGRRRKRCRFCIPRYWRERPHRGTEESRYPRHGTRWHTLRTRRRERRDSTRPPAHSRKLASQNRRIARHHRQEPEPQEPPSNADLCST